MTLVYRLGRYRLEGAVYNLFDSQKFTSIKPGKTVPYDQYYFQPERNFQVSLEGEFLTARRALPITVAVLLMAATGGLAQAQLAQPGASLSAGGVAVRSPAELDPALILHRRRRPGDAPAAGRKEPRRTCTASRPALRTPERLAQARHDDEVEDVSAIADVLGPAFDLGRFPATARLFADLRNEDSVAAKQAKAFFKRERPWLNEPALDVCDDHTDVKNSYPSGHATMGYSAATVLANLMPGNAQVILARTTDYVESRLVCGVHYRSDLEAGHVLGTALVGRLMTKPDFMAELAAARAERTAAPIAPESGSSRLRTIPALRSD